MRLLYLQRLVGLLEETRVAELIPRFDVHQSGCTGATDDGAGGAYETRATRIDGAGQKAAQEGRTGNVAGTDEHRDLVLSCCAHRELDLGNVGIIGIRG